MKLDLRMVFERENKQKYLVNSEFAKIDSTKSKDYNDKTKLVLAAKCHLNDYVLSLNDCSLQAIKSLKLPVTQVMGLDMHIYYISLIDKDVYILQKIEGLTYPRTLQQIKSGEIKKLTSSGFNLLEVMVHIQ